MMSLASETTGDLTSIPFHLWSECSGIDSDWDFVKVPRVEFALTVQSPKTVLSMAGSYTSYCLVFTTESPCFRLKKTIVRRRFRDFVWLRKQLAEMDHCRHPPPLAGWRFWNIFDSDFIQKRQQHLEKWLYTVLSEPMYLSCSALHLFLQTELSTPEMQDYLDGHTPEETIQQIWANHGQRYNYQPHNPLQNCFHQQPTEIIFTEEDLRISRDARISFSPVQEQTLPIDILNSSAFSLNSDLVNVFGTDLESVPDSQITDDSPDLPQSGHPQIRPLAVRDILLRSYEQRSGQELDVHGRPEDDQEMELQDELNLKPESEQGFSPHHPSPETPQKEWNLQGDSEPEWQREHRPYWMQAEREPRPQTKEYTNLHAKRNTCAAADPDIILQTEHNTAALQHSLCSTDTHSGAGQLLKRRKSVNCELRTLEGADPSRKTVEKMTESPWKCPHCAGKKCLVTEDLPESTTMSDSQPLP